MIFDGVRFVGSQSFGAERRKDGARDFAFIEAESVVAGLPEQVARTASRFRVQLREAEPR